MLGAPGAVRQTGARRTMFPVLHQSPDRRDAAHRRLPAIPENRLAAS